MRPRTSGLYTAANRAHVLEQFGAQAQEVIMSTTLFDLEIVRYFAFSILTTMPVVAWSQDPPSQESPPTRVGAPAEDVLPPEISVQPPIVDNDEGSVLVEIETADDVGVAMIDVWTPAGFKRIFGDRFKGYLRTSRSPGATELGIRATDGSARWSQTRVAFDYRPANRVLRSRFENLQYVTGDIVPLDGWYSGGWLLDDPLMVREDDPDGAFLGQGYVSFSNDRWMESLISIPAEAENIRLGYRYRVRKGLGPGDGELRIQVHDDRGRLLDTVQTIGAEEATTAAFAHDYLKFTCPLPPSYAGQSIILRVASSDAADDAFRIDQVFIAYDATPSIDLASGDVMPFDFDTLPKAVTAGGFDPCLEGD